MHVHGRLPTARATTFGKQKAKNKTKQRAENAFKIQYHQQAEHIKKERRKSIDSFAAYEAKGAEGRKYRN